MILKSYRIIFFIAIGGLLFLKAGWSETSDTSLTYHAYDNADKTGGVIAETLINIKHISDDQTIIDRQKQSKICMVKDEFVLDREYSIKSWRRTCPEEDTEYTAERKGKFLIIKGKLRGEVIDKEIELGNKALYIYPKYSLSKFALSGMPKMKFWTIRRDRLSKLPMQAVRKGVETVMINGEEVEAIKVYYSITGKLREMHYNHNYYFRKSDGLFLKKEEQNGRVEKLVKEE